MAQRNWFREVLSGRLVTLRRHVPQNVAAFRRWYADPEIARLARYQQTPMRPEEIERFFAARAVGPDALAMAVHERATGRLIGTCAFSQLDGDNGSALYHITIGESDAWGRGYGTEATQLMIDHAFGTLGLHRIALYVFEFNERAIRAYRRCGFVVEGRSRESIWRDGRWWDELAMSILESDWQRIRDTKAGQGRDRRLGGFAAAVPAAHPLTTTSVAADAARADVRELIGAKGHTVDNARAAVARLETAFANGALERTTSLDLFLGDLMRALEQDDDQKLGGKSAEAARFILRAIDRELDRA
jgi:RimJ/RimL family protein N-acetyltransferase